MDIKQKKNCVIYFEQIQTNENAYNMLNILKHSKRYSVICLLDPFFSKESNINEEFEVRYGLPVFRSIKDSILYSRSIGNEITNLVVGLENNYMHLNDVQKECIIGSIMNGLDIDSGLFDKLTDVTEILTHSKKHNCAVNDIRCSIPYQYTIHSQSKMEKLGSVMISVIGMDRNSGSELSSFLINEHLKEEGYKSLLLGNSIYSWLLGADDYVFSNSLINQFIPSAIENKIYSMWEKSKPHYIIVESGGGLLNPVNPSGLEFLISGHPDIIILHHSLKRKFYSGSNEIPIHSIQRQIRTIEAVSGKSVSAITINPADMPLVKWEETYRKIRLESDIPVYESNLNGMKKLVKYLGNISGRINYKKVKFQRRSVSV